MPPRDPNRGKNKFIRHEHSYNNILSKGVPRRLVRPLHEGDDATSYAVPPRSIARERYDIDRLPTGASTSDPRMYHALDVLQFPTTRTTGAEASLQRSGQDNASNSGPNKAVASNKSFIDTTNATDEHNRVSFTRCIYDCWTYALSWTLAGLRDALSGRMLTILLALLANSSRSASTYCHFHPTISRVCHTFGVQAVPVYPQPDVNFTSLGLGASIIPEITSPTYSRYRPDVNAARAMMGYEPQKSLPPSTILQYARRPGHCWPLSGNSGYVGIKLSARIRIKRVSLEHIAPETQSHETAPRNMRLWGVEHYPAELGMSSTPKPELNEPSSGLVSLTEAAFGPEVVLVLLASLHHDPISGHTTQSFNLTQQEAPYLQHVVLEIVDNWGDGSRTCLYGLRVYGVPEAVL